MATFRKEDVQQILQRAMAHQQEGEFSEQQLKEMASELGISHGINPVRSCAEHALIGSRWKSSNGCSRGILTDRGLDLTLIGGRQVAMQFRRVLKINN